MSTFLKAGWLVPAGLVLLGLVPVIAGGVRLRELVGGPEVTPANARTLLAKSDSGKAIKRWGCGS